MDDQERNLEKKRLTYEKELRQDRQQFRKALQEQRDAALFRISN